MGKAKLYVMIGAPASGKSTYAKNNFKESIILSSDEIRKELLGSEENQSNNALIFKTLYDRARKYLKNNKNVVIDSTSINKFERTRVLSNFQGFDIEKIAVYIDTPIEICYERDEKRNRTVGREVIDKYFNKFEYPTLDEGFDKVEVVVNA